MISTLDNTIDVRQEFKSLFEYSVDFLFIYDFEGRILDVNEIVIKALGYSREELLAKNIRTITPAKWYEIEDDITFTLLSEEESKIYEKEFIRRDGLPIPVNVRLWILLDEQGDPYRIWAIARDITDIKQMENELKEINRLRTLGILFNLN